MFWQKYGQMLLRGILIYWRSFGAARPGGRFHLPKAARLIVIRLPVRFWPRQSLMLGLWRRLPENGAGVPRQGGQRAKGRYFALIGYCGLPH